MKINNRKDILNLKKINALLHDVTIINFLLVAKLAKRYRFVTIIFLIFGIIFSTYFYLSQVTVHSKKVFFKVYSHEDPSASNKRIADVMGDMANSFLNQGELTAIISNYDFTRELAEKIVDSPLFSQYDFNNPSKKESKSHYDLFKKCSDKLCKISVVQGIIPSLFTLESELGTSRFILSVSTKSDLTTIDFIDNFKKTLYQNRYRSAVADLEKQIEQVQKIIEISRSSIASKGGFTQLAPGQTLDALITLQNDKIRAITQRLSAEVDEYHYQQIRLKESGVSANKDIDGANKLEYENYTKISKRVNHLRHNIASINSTPLETRSETDNLILNQLKDELKEAETELEKIGRIKRNINVDDKFINTQINNKNTFEFDYKVSSEKVKKIQREVELAKKELDDLFKKKERFDNENLTLKPDLEYLKSMENKLVSLKMMKLTAKSDVVFDHYGPEVNSFKRNSLIQIILFSFVLILFLLFVFLVIIYAFDDRIHDEFEIEKCFSNLPVIGTAPRYHS